jgi:hypothetical protein
MFAGYTPVAASCGGSSFAGDGFEAGGTTSFFVGATDAAAGGLNEEAPGLKLKDAAAGFILKDDGVLSDVGAGGMLSA